MKILKYLSHYFLIVTAFSIAVAFTTTRGDLLFCASLMAGISYFGHLLIVTENTFIIDSAFKPKKENKK